MKSGYEPTRRRITKADREKAEKGWYMIYEIYTVRYKFENIYVDETGVPYGYCKKNRVWCWLYQDGVSLYGREAGFYPGKLIEDSKRSIK